MDKNDAVEQAYKRGYEDGKKSVEKVGRWTDDGKCSECGSQGDVERVSYGFYTKDVKFVYKKSRYCSECGTRMREGE